MAIFHFSHNLVLPGSGVSASLRERAGKPLLASGRTEELEGFGCLLDAAESFALKLGAKLGSGLMADNSSESFQASFRCSSNINAAWVFSWR